MGDSKNLYKESHSLLRESQMIILNKYFLRDPSQKWFWFLFSLIVKGLPFLILLHSKPLNDIPGFWGIAHGDSYSYLAPIESFISSGNYQPDFRMPGYGIVFYPFLLLFSKAIACNIIITLQYIAAAISVYYLALTAKNILASNRVFYITFYLFLFSYYTNFYDAYIQTEAFFTAALIFAVYYFTEYYQRGSMKYLLCTSLLLCWLIFMRPVFLPILLLFALLILLNKNLPIASRFKTALLLLIPFLVCDTAWVVRNYSVHRRFIPLTVSALYPYIATSYMQPMFEFEQAWGGSAVLTDNKTSAIDSVPNDIYTSQFNNDSLVHLKDLIASLQQANLDSAKDVAYENELKTKFALYKLSIAKEKPFLYYFIAPLKLTKDFLYGQENRDMLERGKGNPIIGSILVLFNKVLYLLIVLLGFIGAFIVAIKGFRHNYFYWLISLIPLYILIIHPIILRYATNRFLIPAYPFLIACTAYILCEIYARLSQKPI
ncbi:MAG TPA: hypothetical protein VK806_01050 [Bacteroidia bacterium]|jgi:hypothetical protein|nr:hypothetical protein [Bacteroidia bacterium]